MACNRPGLGRNSKEGLIDAYWGSHRRPEQGNKTAMDRTLSKPLVVAVRALQQRRQLQRVARVAVDRHEDLRLQRFEAGVVHHVRLELVQQTDADVQVTLHLRLEEPSSTLGSSRRSSRWLVRCAAVLVADRRKHLHRPHFHLRQRTNLPIYAIIITIITGGRSSTSVNGDIAIQWEWSNFDHS